MRLSSKLSCAALGAVALVANPLAAFAAESVITNPQGPLERIAISDTLNCSVNYKGDQYNEFYNGRSYDDVPACGTLLAVGDAIYGPETLPAAWNGGLHQSSWTPVSQTKGGSGTDADPWVFTTVVTGGGFEITQTDTYVAGHEFYSTTSSVKNVSGAALNYTLYHAADCFLQDDDYGYGEHDPDTGTIVCRAKDPDTGKHTDKGRVEQFVPTTPGSNYYYGRYSRVWNKVNLKQPLPNVLDEADRDQDNGMSLSWSRSLEPNATASYSMITSFSPKGQVALSSTTCAVAQPGANAEATRTIGVTIVNPNPEVKSVQTITATLSGGATYVAGSATGAPEPTVDGQVLTFKGLELPAGGETKFSFLITGSAEATPMVSVQGSTTSGAAIAASDTSGSQTCDFPELPKPQEQPKPQDPQEQPKPQPAPKADPKAGPVKTTPTKKSQSNKGLASTGSETLGALALAGMLGVGGIALVARRRMH